VSEFYRQLAEGGATRTQALQRAQRKLLASTIERHPGYWAPFLLVGNWQ